MEKIGKYDVIRLIGRGGMGKVYQARDPQLDRNVAIKLMSEAQLVDDDLRERFYREARAAGNLKHPNIIIIYDLSEEKGAPYIVMEYLEGKDLKQQLGAGKGLPLDDCLSIAIQVAKGLSYAHSHGIIHRDIKPANIRVLDNGQVKIMDFGIARVATSEMTKTGHLVGTPAYMSPEQISGQRVDKRTDIWSLGAILYEMVSGRRPFEAGAAPGTGLAEFTELINKILNEEPPALTGSGTDVDEQLAAIVQRSLSKEPAARQADAEEMTRELESYVWARSTSATELRAELDRDIQKYLQLATTLLLKKRFDEAKEAARRVEVFDRENPEAKQMLERIERERDQARREQESVAMIERARGHLRKLSFEAAEESVEQAVALARESSKVQKMGKEILTEIERVRRERSVAAKIEAARQAIEARKLSEARRVLEAALSIDPHNREVTQFLETVRKKSLEEERSKLLAETHAAIDRGDYRNARRLLEGRLDRYPQDRELRALLNEILESQTVLAQALVETEIYTGEQTKPRAGHEEAAERGSERTSEIEVRSGETYRLQEVASTPTHSPPVAQVATDKGNRRGIYWGLAAGGVVLLVVAAWLVIGHSGPTGSVSIDVAPWAEISSLRALGSGEAIDLDSLGVKVTPCFLSLPEGRYEIQFVNPHFPRTLTMELTVRAGQTVKLRGVIPGLRHEELIPVF